MTIPSVLEHLVIEISEFVDAGFCGRVIDRASTIGFERATITSENGISVSPEIRNNDRVIFDDIDLADETPQPECGYNFEPAIVRMSHVSTFLVYYRL